MKILVMHKPDDYFNWLGADISQQFTSASEIPDFIHLFAASTAVFKKEILSVLKFCKKNTSIIVWVSHQSLRPGIKKIRKLLLICWKILSVNLLYNITWLILKFAQ